MKDCGQAADETSTMRLKLSLLEVCMIVVTIGVLVAILAPALTSKQWDFDQTHRFPPAIARPGRANWDAIAGDYVLWGYHGPRSKLSILSDGRYSLIEFGRMGVVIANRAT